jgi:hypothetical protein
MLARSTFCATMNWEFVPRCCDLDFSAFPGILRREVKMGSQIVNSLIVWVDIPCVDLDRAIAFYSAVLGCAVAKQEGPGFAMGILPHGVPPWADASQS